VVAQVERHRDRLRDGRGLPPVDPCGPSTRSGPCGGWSVARTVDAGRTTPDPAGGPRRRRAPVEAVQGDRRDLCRASGRSLAQMERDGGNPTPRRGGRVPESVDSGTTFRASGSFCERPREVSRSRQRGVSKRLDLSLRVVLGLAETWAPIRLSQSRWSGSGTFLRF